MKKLISIISLITSLFVLSACDGNDPEKCLNSVKTAFPNAVVYSTHDAIVTFIAIDTTNNTVFKVSTQNITNPNITDVIPLIKR